MKIKKIKKKIKTILMVLALGCMVWMPWRKI